MNNPVSQLSPAARRTKRLKYWVLSPCFFLVGPLALAAAWALITQPSTGSLLIGIPTLALVFYYLFIQFQEEWSGEYQRLVIMTNINIQEVIEKKGTEFISTLEQVEQFFKISMRLKLCAPKIK